MRITPAICFMDLSGFTDLTEQRQGRAYLGDGVMLYFGSAEDAVPAALEMLDATAEAGLPPAHIGIHAGPVVFQGGDYFGRTVNLAARIMGHAGRDRSS
jgi:adenylate cyclase